jgi:hypothetical protein
MLELPPLPDDLPWSVSAYLLLDGVSVPNLPQRLSRWDNPVHGLYQGTRWQELADISPRLVTLNGADDPVLAHFQENAALEWGFLLFSDADVSTLLKHWRHLLTVKHPSAGRSCHASPTQPSCIICSTLHGKPTVRAGSAPSSTCVCRMVFRPPGYNISVRISRARQQRYLSVDRGGTHGPGRGAVSSCGTRPQRSPAALFPRFHGVLPRPGAPAVCRKNSAEAHRLGFTSEQEITLYANVYAYLSGQPLSDHPDIVELLTVSTQQSPLSRVQRAAELAYQRSTQLPGDVP